MYGVPINLGEVRLLDWWATVLKCDKVAILIEGKISLMGYAENVCFQGTTSNFAVC